MTPSGRDRTPSAISKRLEQVRETIGIGTKDVWRALTEECERGGGTERWYKVEGKWHRVSYAAVRTWHRDRDPPFHYVARFAQVFDQNPEWLLTGSKTWLDRAREEMARGALSKKQLREALAYLKLDCGDKRRAPDRRAAVLRFSRRLDDARGPDVPWDAPDVYWEVLAGAMRFLVQVDEAASEAARLDPEADKDTAAGKLASPWFLPNSAAKGWYVTWSDAVLDLYARRVIGLGERAGGLTDSHAPAAPRR